MLDTITISCNTGILNLLQYMIILQLRNPLIPTCLFLLTNTYSIVLGYYRLCDGQSGTLGCPRGQRIQVHYANYGRTTGASVCPHRSIQTIHCYSDYSSRVIRCACQNQQYCLLYAHHLNFGDPCYGTYKYIEVAYSCV